MPCVMRREGRGVLHLGKYSPPKGNCSVEEERKREKEKEKERTKKDNGKGKRTSSSLINKQRSYSSERICTSRGRGSLLLWLVFV